MRWDNVRADAQRMHLRAVPDSAKVAVLVAVDDAADLGWVRTEEGLVAVNGNSLVVVTWEGDETQPPTSVTIQTLSLARVEQLKMEFDSRRLHDHFWDQHPIKHPLGRASLVLDLVGTVPTVLNIDVPGTGDDDPAAALVSTLLAHLRDRHN
ncbi:MAG TPA: hypothetical protein VLB85_07635 [Acidimicrobiia bacterium]|nr:hypothetical protein [Acidimicrobiia bacterium]